MLNPVPLTHEQRITIAHTLADRLLTRYGAYVKAIGMYGSVARGDDGPFSDIELICVLTCPPDQTCYEWWTGSWKAEVDLYSVEAIQKKASTVYSGWPLNHSSYLQTQPLYDPNAFLAELKPLVFSASEESFRAVIEELLIEDIYEMIIKVRNTRVSQMTGYLAKSAVDLAWSFALVVGLAHRHCYTTRTSVLPEALTLSDLPDGFAALCSLVMDGDLRDHRHVATMCEAAWQGVYSWSLARGYTLITPEAIPF